MLSTFHLLSAVHFLSATQASKLPLSALNVLCYHAKTAFLFTKSDIKTMLLPIVSSHAGYTVAYHSLKLPI